MNTLFLRRLTLILFGVAIILVLGIAVRSVVLKFQTPIAVETPIIVDVNGDSVTPVIPGNSEDTDGTEVDEVVVDETENEVDEEQPTPPVTETETETETEVEVEVKPEPKPEPLNYKTVSFFMDSRMERYEAYALDNPTFSVEEIVMKVNMNLDYDFYTHIVEIEVPDDLLVLCNKFYQLPSDFTPQNLEKVPAEYHVNDGKAYDLDRDALNAFIDMSDHAKEEGISLKIISAYRSNEFQAYLYNKYKTNNGEKNADRYSARPGHSEHETGLAIDINDVSQAFENTKAFKWLQENAHKYGYILRYPKNMENITGYMYEPWHYRYIGVETATDVRSKNITFDAYYAMNILPYKNR
jgi:LAS superfamily LD-carboxypeptidase LdcB